MSNKLVVIEGLDGAGTETQSKKLLEYLREKGEAAERFVFPDYEHPTGKVLKAYLEKKFDLPVDVLFLMFASNLVSQLPKLRGWLKEGKTVVTDRYFTSTIVWQGAEGFKTENALKFAEIFSIPKPDKILYLKVSPTVGMERKLKESATLDRHEGDKMFLTKIEGSYGEAMKDNMFGSWFAIDGEKSIEDVFEQIKKVLNV